MSRHLDPRYYFEEARRFYQHKQQFYRHWLGLLADFHRGSAVGHLFGSWFMSKRSMVRLDVLAVVLSIASRRIWLSLFRNPAQLWGIRRPRRSYYWTIYVATSWTIFSTLVVDVLLVAKSWELRNGFWIDFWHALFQLLLWIGISSVCLWMVWEFLGGIEEEIYEPSTTSTLSFLVDGMEPYADAPQFPPSHDLGSSHLGHLSAAYRAQQAKRPLREDIIEETGGRNIVEVVEPSQAATSPSTDHANPSLCPTLARYNYLPQSRMGPHSWFTLPLVSLGLGLYGTFFMAIVVAFRHENDRTRLPYRNTKPLWYLPLGILLFSFYSRKHTLRYSLFTNYQMQFPGPWKWKEVRLLPAKPVFKNVDTGVFSPNDPRLRAFPNMKDGGTAALQSRAYLLAYNTKMSSCTEYWGHLGRQWNKTSLLQGTRDLRQVQSALTESRFEDIALRYAMHVLPRQSPHICC